MTINRMYYTQPDLGNPFYSNTNYAYNTFNCPDNNLGDYYTNSTYHANSNSSYSNSAAAFPSSNVGFQGSNSHSPMPSMCTMSYASSAKKTPENVSKIKGAVMSYSLQPDEDGNIQHDAIATVQALGQPEHAANKVLTDYSEMISKKEDMDTPAKAKAVVSVFQSLKKQKLA